MAAAPRAGGDRPAVAPVRPDAAGRQAYDAAGWRDELGGERVGAVFGSYGDKLDMGRMAEVAYRSRTDGASEILPSAFFERYCREFRGHQLTRLLPHHATVRLARMYGALGPTCTIQTACTSSAQAIGESFRMIRRGTVDRAICGGAGSTLYEMLRKYEIPKATSH